MTMRILLTSAAASTMLALPAFAGGLTEPVVAPAPVPVPVAPAPVARGADWSGFYAGGQLGYGRAESDAFGEDGEDFLYGAHAGYNYDFGQFVLGGELDVDGTNISDSDSGIDLDAVARLKLRAGYDAGQYMPYVVAGAAQAYTGGALDDDDTGAFAGVGLDYQMSPNLRVGGEILRHQFDDFADSGADIDATTISGRVSYNF